MNFPTILLTFCLAVVPASEVIRKLWFSRSGEVDPSEQKSLTWVPPQGAEMRNLLEARGGDILAYDDGIWASLRNEDESVLSDVMYLEYEKGNDHMLLDLFIHSPEICMPATGAELIREFPVKDWSFGGQDLAVRHWLFRAPLSGKLVHAFKMVWVADDDFLTESIRKRDFQSARLRAAMRGKTFSQARMILTVSQGANGEGEAWQDFQEQVLAGCE